MSSKFLHRQVRSLLHCSVRSFLQLCQVADRQASGNRLVAEGQCQSGKHVWMLKAV